MYNKKLSDLFGTGLLYKNYPWNWNFKIEKKPKKILYSIGDSWLDRPHFKRVVQNNYPEYLHINRAIDASSNSLIVKTIQNDFDFLNELNTEITFLVCFSEVGRSINDLGYEKPSAYSSTQEYFGMILRKQYDQVSELLKAYPNYITTAFVSNNFNDKKSILDFCGNSYMKKPKDVFTMNAGMYDYLKDRKNIFRFNFAEDIKKSLELREFILSHEYTDDTCHPDRYKVFELFLENVFLSLKK